MIKALSNLSRRQIIVLKVVAWTGCLLPVGQMAYSFFTQTMGANPIEYVTLKTGQSTLILLLVTLAVTPLRRLSGWNWLIRFRRLFGLFAFFYGVLHLITYVWFDKFFDFGDIVHDVTKRPFILYGMTAFLSMVPLALTSTTWSIRKLGGKRWNALHRLTYLSAVAGVVHFWFKVKADHSGPALYGVILIGLLGYRVVASAMKRRTPGQPRVQQA